MSEISEKTRVGLTIGGAVVILAFVFGVGRYWGGVENERVSNREAISDLRNRTGALEQRVANMDKLLIEIRSEQKTIGESATTTARNSTAALWALQNMKVALASAGIKFNDPDED